MDPQLSPRNAEQAGTGTFHFKFSLALLLSIFIAAASPRPPDNAIEKIGKIQKELRDARAAKNWRASAASANELKQLLNGSPDSLLELARADVHTGDIKNAFHALEQFGQMGQSTDLIERSAEFSPLRHQARYTEILKKMAVNRRPVSLGANVFTLADASLLAEDIDYDPGTKRFFITSVREKKIITGDSTGTFRDFAPAPDSWPMLAIKVDSQRGVVWATEVAMQGVVFAPEADWGRSAVVCYDLKDGKLLRRIEGPYGSALGDMALMANGDAIVSDGESGGVYRVSAHGDVLERLDNGDFISPQTPALHPDGKHIFVPDYARGIGLLEMATKHVRWLPMEGRFALTGIDGLYFEHGLLIAVQNGTSPERVVVFTLNAALTRIVSEKIIERSTATLGDPTHGVVIGDDFYYIANSGWDVIDDHGNMKPGASVSVARIMRAPL